MKLLEYIFIVKIILLFKRRRNEKIIVPFDKTSFDNPPFNSTLKYLLILQCVIKAT